MEGLRVLEIGAGIGSITLQLAAQRCVVDAYEINNKLREFSKARLGWLHDNDKVIGRMGEITWNGAFDPTAIPDELNGTYDLIVAIDVLEHMDEKTLTRVMGKITALLKPGGRLFCHNAWGDQTTDQVHPFHYDHRELWRRLVRFNRLFQLSSLWVIKEHEF